MATKQPAAKTKRQSAPGAAKKTSPSSRGAAAPRRHAAQRRPAAGSPAAVTPEERYRMIAEAAYNRAQLRGFTAGGEVQDWLEAEAEIDARLLEA